MSIFLARPKTRRASPITTWREGLVNGSEMECLPSTLDFCLTWISVTRRLYFLLMSILRKGRVKTLYHKLSIRSPFNCGCGRDTTPSIHIFPCEQRSTRGKWTVRSWSDYKRVPYPADNQNRYTLPICPHPGVCVEGRDWVVSELCVVWCGVVWCVQLDTEICGTAAQLTDARLSPGVKCDCCSVLIAYHCRLYQAFVKFVTFYFHVISRYDIVP